MADEPTVTPPEPKPADDSRAAFYERDKAMARAQKLEKELEALRAKLPSEDTMAEYQALKDAAAKAEEERQRKAGEFDKIRAEDQKRYEKLIEGERKKAEEAQALSEKANQKYQQNLIRAEFAAASSLFGDSGKTTLPADVAQAWLGKHVLVEADDKGAERVVVKDLAGDTILDLKTGKPAPFAQAMSELIDGLPQRDTILRASMKTGSGSSGGGTHTGLRDLNRLTPADFNDPNIRAAVRAKQNAAGGLQIGPAWDTAKR